jgi:hypothetical protein
MGDQRISVERIQRNTACASPAITGRKSRGGRANSDDRGVRDHQLIAVRHVDFDPDTVALPRGKIRTVIGCTVVSG